MPKRVHAVSGLCWAPCDVFTPVFLFLAATLKGANIPRFSSSLFQSVGLLSSPGFVFHSRLFFSSPVPSLWGFLTCFWQVTYFSLLDRLGPFVVRLRWQRSSAVDQHRPLQRPHPLKLIPTKTKIIWVVGLRAA